MAEVSSRNPSRAFSVPWLGRVLWPKFIRSRRATLAHRLTRLAFLLVGLGIAVGIHVTAVWFLALCHQVEVVGPLLVRRLLDMVLLVLLSVLLLSNLVTALSSFFLAKDLDLLAAAPIPARTLFSARFLEQVLHSSWMVLAFGLPVLLAFARVAGTPISYLALVGALPPLLILPAAGATIIVLMMVLSFPAARVRDLVIGLLFVGFIVLYIVARLVEPERFINPEGFASMVSFLSSFSAPSSPFLPSHWATAVIADTFVDSAGGQDTALKLAALWTSCFAAHAVGSLVFRHTFAAAYSRSQEGKKVARLSRIWARVRGRAAPLTGELRSPGRVGAKADGLRIAGCVVRAGAPREFLIKDLKLLVRDASQWSQLVLLLALVFVYLYNFRYFRTITESGLVGRLALTLIGMGLSGFVTTAVSIRFAFPLVSLEGRMLWFLCAAPLRPREILWAKVISTAPPLIVVSLVMGIASASILGASSGMIALSAGVATLTAIAAVGIAIGLGAALPDYGAESAAKVAASFGGLVCMSVSLLAAFLLVGCAIYPALVIYTDRVPSLIGLALSTGAALLVTFFSAFIPLLLGARALDRYEP